MADQVSRMASGVGRCGGRGREEKGRCQRLS